jgi:hypothetical protein
LTIYNGALSFLYVGAGTAAAAAFDSLPWCAGGSSDIESHQADNHHRHRHRVAWARLLARVFHIDVTVCPACGGHMKMIAALTDGSSVRKYLAGVGLPWRAPPIAPARIDRQLKFDEAASGPRLAGDA